LAISAHHRGHLSTAAARFEELLDHPSAAAEQKEWAQELMIEVLALGGRFAEAEAMLDRYAQMAPWPAGLAVRRALVATARGDHSHYQAYGGLVDSFAEMGLTAVPYRAWLSYYAEGLGHAGRADEGIALMTGFVRDAEAFRSSALVAQGLLALGRLTRGDEQIAYLERCVAVVASSANERVRGWAHAELGAAYRRAGRRTDAREPLRAALDYAERHGEAVLAERAREEFTLAGFRPRNPFATGAESLTPAEARTARLAADGLSNKQIAAELFLTVGTVQITLVRVFRKLDIKSRRQLPDALAART
jgi:DNA-binding CsgD family transcriptional regulator